MVGLVFGAKYILGYHFWLLVFAAAAYKRDYKKINIYY